MIENLTAKTIEEIFGLSNVTLYFDLDGPEIIDASEDFSIANISLKKRWNSGSLTLKCSQRQLRLWLNSKGLLSIVENAIKGADKATQIEWEFADEFRRNHSSIEAIGAIVGLSKSQIDQAFEEASEI
jgi:hypothetical protein